MSSQKTQGVRRSRSSVIAVWREITQELRDFSEAAQKEGRNVLWLGAPKGPAHCGGKGVLEESVAMGHVEVTYHSSAVPGKSEWNGKWVELQSSSLLLVYVNLATRFCISKVTQPLVAAGWGTRFETHESVEAVLCSNLC